MHAVVTFISWQLFVLCVGLLLVQGTLHYIYPLCGHLQPCRAGINCYYFDLGTDFHIHFTHVQIITWDFSSACTSDIKEATQDKQCSSSRHCCAISDEGSKKIKCCSSLAKLIRAIVCFTDKQTTAQWRQLRPNQASTISEQSKKIPALLMLKGSKFMNQKSQTLTR